MTRTSCSGQRDEKIKLLRISLKHDRERKRERGGERIETTYPVNINKSFQIRLQQTFKPGPRSDTWMRKVTWEIVCLFHNARTLKTLILHGCHLGRSESFFKKFVRDSLRLLRPRLTKLKRGTVSEKLQFNNVKYISSKLELYGVQRESRKHLLIIFGKIWGKTDFRCSLARLD